MEKRKLLLVIVSVGIFLVVVIGASIMVFSPKSRGTEAVVSARPPIPAGTAGGDRTQAPEPSSADPTEWVRNPQAVQGLQTPPQPASAARGDVIIIYGDNTVQGRPEGDPIPAGASGSGTLVIEVPKPSAAPAASVPAPAAPAPAGAPAAAPAAQKQTVAARPAAQPAKPVETRIYDDYWVQTGSFSSKARAENARTALSSKGISSVLEVKALQDKTYYRVRVGPYASKNEADYWLSLIKSIDGFGESYVSMVKTRR